MNNYDAKFMINQKTILGIIPARGGSKGVEKKNIRMAGGKPLLAWTIEASKKSKYIDRLILSSESPEIIKVAEEWGLEAPFVRPDELAQDETPAIDVALHAIDEMGYFDYIVWLQPTSPLRTVDHIDACIEKCVRNNSKTCISVTQPDKSPYWMCTLDESEQMKPLMGYGFFNKRRQDLPEAFVPNGAVYVAETEFLKQNNSFYSDSTVAYKMPKDLSLDIDTELDLMIFEAFIKKKNST